MKRFQLRQGEPADEAAYLDRLGKCLVGWLPESQVLEVLSDYREQFQVGRERGRTDAEITAAMGAPGDVARGLLAEEPSAKTAGLRQTGLWAAALALCCGFLWINLSAYAFQYGAVLFLPLASSVLFLLLRGGARVELERRFPNGRTVSPALGYYVPFGLVLVFEAAEEILHLLSRIGRLPEQVGPYFVGEVNMIFILALEAVLVVLLAVSLWRSTAVSIRCFPGVIHIFGAGSAAFFVYLYHMTPFLEDPWSPQEALVMALLPYGVGLATALAFQRWVDGKKPLPRIFRDGAVSWRDWHHRLGVNLLGWFDAEQAIEVLEDYQEQYELGREQGRSEEELLSALGRSEAVVRDLLAEDRRARLRRRRTRGWAVLAAAAGWVLLELMATFEFGDGMLFGQYLRWHTKEISCIALAAGTAALLALLHGRERAVLERHFPPEKRPGIWVLLLPVVCVAVLSGLVWYCAAQSWTGLNRPGYYLGKCIEDSTILLSVLMLWALVRCRAGSIRYLPAVIHAAGCIAGMLCAGIFLKGMDFDAVPDMRRVQWYLPWLLPYIVGAALAAGAGLVLRLAGRSRKGA